MAENKKKFRGPEYRVINMISITGKDGEYHPMEDMTEEEIEHQRKISGKNISSRKITAEELVIFRKGVCKNLSEFLSNYYSNHLDEAEILVKSLQEKMASE